MAINLGDYYDWAKDPKKELEKQLNKLMSDQPKQDDIDWGKIYDWAREPETPQQPSTTKQDDVDWGKIFDWAREPEPTPPPEPSTWDKIKSGVSGIFKDKTLKDEAEQAAERAREGVEKERPKMLEKVAEGAKQLVRDLDAGVADFSKYTFYEPLKSIGVYKIPGVGSVLEKLEEGVDQVRAGGGTGIGSQVIRALPGAGIQAALALLTGGTSLAGQIPATGAEAVRQTATQMLKSPTFTTSALRSYGSGYSEAKEAGADNLQAISAGIQQAIPQAMIEQAGGIEQLGKKAGEGVLRSIGRTALEEAGEEILQYPFEGLAKKATYAPETPWFSTKEQAVINPVQQAQSGLVGGIAGGIFGGIGGAVNALRPDVSIEPVTTDDALPQPDFYVDPYGNVATDSQYRPPLLLPPGPDFQARPETNFYVDQYGNVTTDPNYRPFLQLPAGPELEVLNQQGINPNIQKLSEALSQQPVSNEPDYSQGVGERFSPNRLTPANLKALNKRGINPNVTRQSDRLANLNPPIAQPDYQSAAGQIETPFRLFPGELQETLPPVQTPQEARTDVLDSARPNILPDTETPVKSEIQQPEQTFDTKFTVETDEGVQTYDTNDFVDDAGRTLEAYINEDPVYRELTEELRGTSAQSDPVIKQIAPEIKDKSGFAYNVDYPQRGLKNVFGKHWDYVKKKYFDPLDKSKGDYAREVTNRVNKIYNEVVQKYGIQKGSRESAAIQWYGEGERIAGSDRNFLSRMFRPEYEVITDEAGREIRVPKMEKYTLEDLKREFPNKWRDIVEAEKVFRQQYDELIDLINESRKKVYPTVEKQIEYTRQRIRDISQDIKELQRKLKDKNLATNERKDIQRRIDDMNAKREELSNKLESGELWRNKRVPKRKNYFRHFRELTSGIGGLANILASPYQIDPQLAGISEFTKPKSRWASFMQQRGLGEYTADAVGGFLDYIRPAAYAIHIDPHITKIRQLAKDIADATQNTRNANNLIVFLNDYANSLAGKTSRFDRLIQDMIPGGRKAFAVINWLNKRARANAVLGNLRSSITQIANIPAGISEVADPVALTKGMGETLANILGGGRRAIEQSDFIAERYMDSVFDKFDTRLINKPKQFAAWLLGAGDELGTRFTWNSAYYKALKKGIENPIKYADDLTRNVVAGRGVGETPLIQQSKLFQLFFPFTLEVGNIAHVMKNQIKGKEFGKFITILIANWLFNELFESTYGDRPLLDPIDAMADVLTEDDPNFMKVAGRLGGEVLSNIPMGQTVASLWPQYETDVTTPFGGYTIPSRRELFGDADPTRYGTGFLLQEAIQDPFYKLLPPWGGGQLKKTLEGLQTLEEGGYIKDDKLRYLVPPTPENITKSLLFGRSATPEAREYFEKGRRPLSEQQTQAVLQSRDPQEQYRIFMLQREANRIQEQMKEVNRNPDLTTAEKDKRIRELQQKLNKLWATEQ